MFTVKGSENGCVMAFSELGTTLWRITVVQTLAHTGHEPLHRAADGSQDGQFGFAFVIGDKA